MVTQQTKPCIALPGDLTLESPFWHFSLTVWKNAAAQESLLLLQDQYGLIVNRLLFCSWLGFERRILLTRPLKQATQLTQWHRQTVMPLRGIRKTLKDSAPQHPQLRATVQSAELQAEQVEQALLYLWVDQFSRPSKKRNSLEAVAYNLLSYTQEELNDPDKITATKPHLVALVQASIPNHNRARIEACFE